MRDALQPPPHADSLAAQVYVVSAGGSLLPRLRQYPGSLFIFTRQYSYCLALQFAAAALADMFGNNDNQAANVPQPLFLLEYYRGGHCFYNTAQSAVFPLQLADSAGSDLSALLLILQFLQKFQPLL